jgi:hypothetical protein
MRGVRVARAITMAQMVQALLAILRLFTVQVVLRYTRML